MTQDQLLHIGEAVIIGLIILVGVLRFSIMEYRLYKRDQCEVETAPATAFYKHPDMEPVLAGRSSTYVYHITFHTDSGDILKLYMNPTEYHSIQEGDKGKLTWQGPRFWKFEQEV